MTSALFEQPSALEEGGARALIVELAQAFGLRLAPPQGPADAIDGLLQPGSAAARHATAQAWIEARRWRDELLDDDLFADPAWNILLDLYDKHHDRKPVTVSSACRAARVPVATAFRQLSRLVARNWIERHDGDADRRKVQVSLTPRAIEAMDRVMDAALATARRLTAVRTASDSAHGTPITPSGWLG